MAIQFKEPGTILFSQSGTVAMDPACCCTNNCWWCTSSGDDREIDLSDGSLINVGCDQCTAINSSFVLTFNIFGTNCSWHYKSALCAYQGKTYYFVIKLEIDYVSSTTWRYKLLVSLSNTSTLTENHAYYYSSSAHDKTTSACTIPDELTLDADNKTGTLCGGAWPSTVYLS